MARALYHDSVLDLLTGADAGTVLSVLSVPRTTASIEVRQTGTATKIVEPIYAAASGGVTLSNPFNANAEGEFAFYLDDPARVDLYITVGATSQTLTIDVVPAANLIPELDVGKTWSGLQTFTPGVVLGSYAKASLPAAGSTGRVARVSDTTRGLWMDQGAQWFSLTGEVINVEEFGATPGAADSTAAIQAAFEIAATVVQGRTLFFPNSYTCASSLDCAGHDTVTFRGIGGPRGGSSMLTYTGTGSRFLDCRTTRGYSFEHLTVKATNAGFSGKLLDFEHSGVGASDSVFNTIWRCHLLGTGTSATLVSFHQSHTCQVLESDLLDGAVGVHGSIGNATENYSNNILIQGTRIGGQSTACIKNPNESWTVASCVLAFASDGSAKGIVHRSADGKVCRSLTVVGCWIGDANDTGTWIDIDQVQGAQILANHINHCGTAVRIGAASQAEVRNNRFASFTVAGISFDAGTATTGVVEGNSFDTTTNAIVLNSQTVRVGVNAGTSVGAQYPGTLAVAGTLTGSADVTARSGAASQVTIGTSGGLAAITLGSSGDVVIRRSSADLLSIPDRVIVDAPSAGAQAVIARGFSGQTANIFEVRNSADVNQVAVSPAGAVDALGDITSRGGAASQAKIGNEGSGKAALILGSSGDVVLRRDAADLLSIPDRVLVDAPSAGAEALIARAAAAHTANIFAVKDSGDAVLFALEADGDIRTSRSAAATTLGSVARKLQLFDAGGSSIGFVPLYDAIT